MNQSVGNRLNPAIGAIRISRGPVSGALDFAGLDWSIADGRAGEQAVHERDRVNERLEGRANLAVRRCERAIELTLRIIAAPDQGANPAALIIDRNQRSLQIRH